MITTETIYSCDAKECTLKIKSDDLPTDWIPILPTKHLTQTSKLEDWQKTHLDGETKFVLCPHHAQRYRDFFKLPQ